MKTPRIYLGIPLCSLALLLSAQPALALPSGLISHWTADGNALDSADGNDGTLFGGTTYGAGQNGQAFSFDGTDDYVRISDSANLKPSNLTVSFWFNSNQTLDGNLTGFAPFLVKINEGESVDSTVRGYDFWYRPGELVFGLPVATNNREPVIANTNFAAGEWHHVAGTYDQNAMKLYVDGNLVGSRAVTFPVAYSAAPILLGRARAATLSPSENYYDGKLDDIMLYDRALSQSEVQGLAAVPEPSTLLLLGTGLVGLAAYRRKRKA